MGFSERVQGEVQGDIEASPVYAGPVAIDDRQPWNFSLHP